MDAPDEPIRLLLVDGLPKSDTALQSELAELTGGVVEKQSAGDADRTLAASGESDWHAIVLDLEMGWDDVLALLETIQEQPSAPPALVIDSAYRHETCQACMRAGAADYVIKNQLSAELLDRTFRYSLSHARRVKRLEESLRVRDHFLSLLAHDVRGPLGVLASGLELYSRRFRNLPPEKVEKFLRQAEQQTQQIQALTGQVLDWASSQAPDFQPYRTTFSLAECLESALLTLQPLAHNKSISIESSIPEESQLHADRNMWETILRNLLSNAIKFSQPGSRIEVTAVRKGARYHVSVRDHGIGMPETLRRNLLAGRSIAVRRGTGNEKGTGLGLQLCLRFAALHGGSLQIQSEEGAGTCVTILSSPRCLGIPLST